MSTFGCIGKNLKRDTNTNLTNLISLPSDSGKRNSQNVNCYKSELISSGSDLQLIFSSLVIFQFWTTQEFFDVCVFQP